MVPFIGLPALTQLGATIMPDIAMSAYYDRQAVFDKFGIKVISGNEFQNIRYAVRTKGHTTRQKKVGDTIESEAGQLVERKLVTYVAWNRYRVKKNMFRELPRQVGEQLMYPNSEDNLRVALQDYTSDVFDNLFFGNPANHEAGEESGLAHLGLYVGFWTYINKDIEDGFVAPIDLGAAIVYPTTPADTVAWNLFIKFRDAWHPALRSAAKVIVIMSPQTASAIYAAYGNAHNNNSSMGIATNGNYTIPEFPNIEIAFDDCVGVGCRMLATVPDNLEYGVDTLDPENSVTIEPETSRDNDDFIIQPQSAQGTRAFQTDPKHMAMTSASMAPASLGADYYGFVVTNADPEKGTVTVNGVEPDNSKGYAYGTILEIEAVNGTGTFKKWSNGSTDKKITVVVGDGIEAITAIWN